MAISIQIFFASDDLFAFLFQNVSWRLNYTIEYLTLYSALPLFVIFAGNVFIEEFSRRLIVVICSISLLLIVFVLFFPPIVFTETLHYFEVVASASLIYVIYRFFLSFKHKRTDSVLMLAAFAFLGIAAICHILSNEFANEQIEPLPFGLFIFVLLQSVMLARQSAKAYFKLNLQKTELIKHRNNLHQLVKDRTVEVENQKEELTTQNERMNKQHKLLQQQSKEITDSIRYAKNIQNAAMPSTHYFNKILPDSFIFYSPKDIVSGDFYWIRKVNEYVVIVCADCTGHGVPGAFMSMLGISVLNDLVYKKEITQANQILNELRSYIKESLHQNDGEALLKDGFDMSVSVIDVLNKQLQYAGAFSSLFFFRNGKVKILKGDRMPVGIYLKEKDSFTNHIVNLELQRQLAVTIDGKRN